ncbi:amino acid adenylation domain-containing protein [Actinokineospora baliensis]|uniref:non-ribosomal peptide synthetase n=1 Tax=Actinokineospora baliensis TaxID=547056 RepID=UPI0019583492|nr:non-ribosomal peptide synthetase [Actinokineospora baliensis]MBM7774643.1 amino acid adenylation domain-containing protein [Actinokineospora baliensis]
MTTTNEAQALDRAAADEPIRLPLSFGQEQLWFLRQLSPDEIVYNLGFAYRLRGALDVGVLHASLSRVVNRHDMLRSTFGSDDGTPYQVIGPCREVELVEIDLGDLPAAEREQALQDALEVENRTPFDLTRPLYRFKLWRLGGDEHVFWFGWHHIVIDGWSSGSVIAELTATYRALLAGAEPELPLPVMSYAEHIAQQRERLSGEALEEELRYWEQSLAGLPVLELPTDRLRPTVPSGRGEMLSVDCDPQLLVSLRELAQQHGASLFMVLTAAVTIVLARYSGEEDIPLGVPMLGRVDPDLEDVVGMFINMVVQRTSTAGDPTFAELLDRIADTSLDLYEHQEIPLEMVVQRVQPIRDPSRNPLFQVSVQVLGDGMSGAGFQLPGVESERVPIESVLAMFDLVINFWESADSLRLDIGYATDLFDRWRIDGLADHIQTVLGAVAAEPSLRVWQVPLLSESERSRVLAAGRGEVVEFTHDAVHVTIAEVARANPDAVALVCRDVEMTYAELDRRADLVARLVRSHGIEHEDIVAIAMDRDLDALVAMLGVLKAGAAFTMLDPSHPAKRLDYMLRDTATRLLLTRTRHLPQLPSAGGWTVVPLDAEWDSIEAVPADQPLAEWATGRSLAYVIYTSGSTGQPKGVMVDHRDLQCFLGAYRRTFDFGVGSRMLQLPALTFDMSIGEIFTGLTAGATLVLVSPEEGLAPDALSKLMRDQRVTYAGLSPAILSVLDAEPYPDLRGVMSGADAVPAEMVNKWNLPGRVFVDLYGPTEATVACTEYVCEQVDWRTPPPIGHPEENRLVYVVDRAGNLTPPGIAGELLIGGDDGLARGYLNQPELTAQTFIPDPFRPAGRVYRSGDLVRWRPDLELEFLGRIDHQVKLRGLRIELGEIESALQLHPQVRMAVVLLRSDSRGEKQLVGYVTAESEPPPSTAELTRHLGEQLPEYMVPTAWVVLDEFPLTAARKVDRKALPEPVEQGEQAEAEFVPPQTPTEVGVCEIFAEVLALPRVGSLDNFFELGGNSLQAMRAVSRINKKFQVKINIRLLYGRAAVNAIAAKIEEMIGA